MTHDRYGDPFDDRKGVLMIQSRCGGAGWVVADVGDIGRVGREREKWKEKRGKFQVPM
jgi:hypothetical protein